MSKDPQQIQALTFGDSGRSFFGVLAAAISEKRELERSASSVSTSAKGAGEFTFGTQEEFKGGVQGMIGDPKGLNVGQWLENMQREHCDVDPNNLKSTRWGASDRRWLPRPQAR